MSFAIPTVVPNASDSWIDERALSKLRWRCRRGQLENDLFVAGFFDRAQGRISERHAAALLQLMDLSDPDLLDLLLGRVAPNVECDHPAVSEVLGMLRPADRRFSAPQGTTP